MKIRKGCYGGYYAVFPDSEAAEKWYWLFWRVLRRPIACFGQFENAYYLFGQKNYTL
jgi:hypothetical protein